MKDLVVLVYRLMGQHLVSESIDAYNNSIKLFHANHHCYRDKIHFLLGVKIILFLFEINSSTKFQV